MYSIYSLFLFIYIFILLSSYVYRRHLLRFERRSTAIYVLDPRFSILSYRIEYLRLAILSSVWSLESGDIFILQGISRNIEGEELTNDADSHHHPTKLAPPRSYRIHTSAILMQISQRVHFLSKCFQSNGRSAFFP